MGSVILYFPRNYIMIISALIKEALIIFAKAFADCAHGITNM